MFYVVLPPHCGGDFKTPRYAFAPAEDPVEGLVRYAHCPYVGLHIPGVLRILMRGFAIVKIVPIYGDGAAEVIGPLEDVVKLQSARYIRYKPPDRISAMGALERLDRERFDKGLRLNFKVGTFIF
ncbi:hypothetical protein ODS41_03235 [Pyrobaculum sp. 3827-6]|uniref:hypothetical protein n=1 Tax=Pyrobaculum sp. 3827-6 TaxID=2983604 RepID=UPI0021D7DA3D|nr:hypothetical protein [Pyrobaculum sp. 3827-6]MCU7786942.1 hypothetical protein [Pyrobaculum sp. 3827-6]